MGAMSAWAAADAQTHRRTDTQTHIHTDTQIHRYTDMYTCALGEQHVDVLHVRSADGTATPLCLHGTSRTEDGVSARD
jgi:hypothetical protein